MEETIVQDEKQAELQELVGRIVTKDVVEDLKELFRQIDTKETSDVKE